MSRSMLKLDGSARALYRMRVDLGKTNIEMRSPLALLIFILLSVGAGACGGSSANTGSSVRRPSDPATSTVATTKSVSTGAASGTSTTDEEKLNPGGNDDDIPAYGHEASAADRLAVTKLVKRYYAAVAAEDGKAACGLLVPVLAAAVPEDYGRAPGPVYARGNTCATVLSKLFRHLHASAAAFAATEVTDVRIYRNHGFAELHSKVTPNGEIFVERQGGPWRVGVTLGKEQAPIRTTG